MGNVPESLTFEDFSAHVRGTVWERVRRRKLQIQIIAKGSGLTQNTVSRFLSSETKLPHARTVFLIAREVGVRLTLVPAEAPVQQDELVYASKGRS